MKGILTRKRKTPGFVKNNPVSDDFSAGRVFQLFQPEKEAN